MIEKAPGRLGRAWALIGILTFLHPGAGAQDKRDATDNNTPPVQQAAGAAQTVSAREFEDLKAQIAAQQKQIEQLRLALEDQKKLLEKVQPVAAAKTENTGGFTLPASKLGDVASTSPVIPSSPGVAPSSLSPQTGSGQDQAAPLSWNLGIAKLTPLGFIDVTSVFRTTNTGTGIGTNFNSIPYGNTVPGNQTENRFSLQNSRLGFRIDSHILGGDVIGYMESDFLGTAPSNLLDTSNSDTWRLRLWWFDWRKDKFEFLAGQTWSLLVPNRKGISPLPSDLFYSVDMDTNYQAGLSWTRAPEFRITYHATDVVTAAVALENPEQFVTTAVTFPAIYGTSYSTQFTNGTSSSNAPNTMPDVIGKVAFDTKLGDKAMHFEIGGVLREFQAYNVLTGKKNFATGGGGEVNANLEIAKGFHLIANTFFGTGVGRYIFSMVPDVIIRPNGNISTLETGSTVSGFEYSYKPRDNPKNLETLFYSYFGGVYIFNDYSVDAKGKYSGYGYPGSSNAANRTIQEYTFGVNQTLWKNPTWGDLKLLTQYSHLSRNPWSVAPGTPKYAYSNMFWVDLRYDIP